MAKEKFHLQRVHSVVLYHLRVNYKENNSLKHLDMNVNYLCAGMNISLLVPFSHHLQQANDAPVPSSIQAGKTS